MRVLASAFATFHQPTLGLDFAGLCAYFLLLVERSGRDGAQLLLVGMSPLAIWSSMAGSTLAKSLSCLIRRSVSASATAIASSVQPDALDRRPKLMVAWTDYCLGAKKILRLAIG